MRQELPIALTKRLEQKMASKPLPVVERYLRRIDRVIAQLTREEAIPLDLAYRYGLAGLVLEAKKREEVK